MLRRVMFGGVAMFSFVLAGRVPCAGAQGVIDAGKGGTMSKQERDSIRHSARFQELMARNSSHAAKGFLPVVLLHKPLPKGILAVVLLRSVPGHDRLAVLSQDRLDDHVWFLAQIAEQDQDLHNPETRVRWSLRSSRIAPFARCAAQNRRWLKGGV
jgi:hypothetical protein